MAQPSGPTTAARHAAWTSLWRLLLTPPRPEPTAAPAGNGGTGQDDSA